MGASDRGRRTSTNTAVAVQCVQDDERNWLAKIPFKMIGRFLSQSRLVLPSCSSYTSKSQWSIKGAREIEDKSLPKGARLQSEGGGEELQIETQIERSRGWLGLQFPGQGVWI